MATIEEVVDLIQGLENRLRVLEVSAMPLAGEEMKCTPEMPHDTMVWMRGIQQYQCRCGKRYRKGTLGTLVEVM